MLCIPLVSSAAPHHLTEDEMYEVYHMPKNTVIAANLWYRGAY